MAIKYLKHNEIDKHKWDGCLDAAKNRLIYGYSWYLDIVCENWDALILDNYRAVMPLPWKSKFGIKFIYHPFFSQQLGVFYKEGISFNLADFIGAIPKIFLKYEFALNYNNACEILPLNKRVNYLLNLNKKYDELLARYDTKCRRNVKLSKNEDDVSLVNNLPINILLNLKKENAKNDLTEHHYRTMHSLLSHLIDKKMAFIIGVSDKNNILLGAAAFIHKPNRIIYLFSASSTLGKKKRVMYRILDHVIFENAEKNIFLDFEGSMIESIARFFRSFGGKTETYYRINKSRIPFFK
ncbi:MAG: hypothetical protein PF517_06780 [Salinivirgaceae bacterium]|jgi:hypothetical protein|nr:hypothetical protein [Salinivirgaceae bacterium]